MFKKVQHVHTSETRGCTKGFVCIFIEKATQVKRVSKKSFGEIKPGLRKGNNDIKVEICQLQRTN